MERMNSKNISDKFNLYLTRYWILAYILVIVANLIIRLMGLPSESLNGDDAFSVFFAQQSIENLYERLMYDRNPPFYFFLLHFWIKLFGLNSIVLKGLSVLFSIGTAFFLLKLSTRYFNKLTAILVSILFILSNVWLMASHELRAFSLVGFLTVLSFYYYLNTIKQSRISCAIGLTITNLLLLFSHYISFYIPILQFLCSFLFLRENKKGFRYYIYSQVAALILYFPWLKIVIDNIPDQGSFWLTTAGLQRLNTVFTNLSGNALIWNIHLIFLGSFILLFLIDKKKRFIKREFDIKLAFILLLWYLFPILMNYFMGQFTPIFRLMYLLYASLGLILILSYIISDLKIHYVFKLTLIIVLLYFPLKIFTPYRHVNENWKDIVPKVMKLKDDNTVVLICDWPKHRSFAYYYNLEIFNDYKNIIPELRKNNIHAIGDSNTLKTVVYNWADKIIYARSHDNVGDPQNTNVALLNRNNYKLCKRFGRDMLHVEIYLKDSIPCDSLIPVHIFPGENCGMWKKALVSTFYNDKLVRYFNDMENDPDCELVRNRINSPVYQGKYAAIVVDSLEYCSPLILPIQEIDTISEINISLMAFMENFNDACIVCSIDGTIRSVFWTSYDMKNSIKNLNTWEKVSTTIKLPERRGKNTELRVYIWNPNPDPVYIDDVEICF
jgi:hypothetical protein